MNVIKLQPDQYGSVWYLPEGLPGVFAIFNRSRDNLVFFIKTNESLEILDFYRSDLYFVGERLRSEWGHIINQHYRPTFRLPSFNYRFEVDTIYYYRHSYVDYNRNAYGCRTCDWSCVDDYINQQFKYLKFAYDHNQTFSTKVRRRMSCLYQSMKSWYYRMQ